MKSEATIVRRRTRYGGCTVLVPLFLTAWMLVLAIVVVPTTSLMTTTTSQHPYHLQLGASSASSAGSSTLRRSSFLDHFSFELRRQEFSTSATTIRLSDALLENEIYATKSKAKKACQLGFICLLKETDKDNNQNINGNKVFTYQELLYGPFIIGNDPTMLLEQSDQIWRIHRRRSSIPAQGYPVSVTKSMFPPKPITLSNKMMLKSSSSCIIVYQDDHMAIVNKPENMTTIGGKQDQSDLHTLLGYILTAPTSLSNNKNGNGEYYHPRPVHRLDRPTSGLVVVAKSQYAMKVLSEAFANRAVTKTYAALVFENDDDVINHDNTDTDDWNTIDYPMDGKSAISSWRWMKTTATNSNNSNSMRLLQVRPHTGRMHQIRRHLSYCLRMPIVGDAKYDKGQVEKKKWRSHGLYLCCHALEIPYPFVAEMNNTTTTATITDTTKNVKMIDKRIRFLEVSISLPRKFQDQIGNEITNSIE